MLNVPEGAIGSESPSSQNPACSAGTGATTSVRGKKFRQRIDQRIRDGRQYRLQDVRRQFVRIDRATAQKQEDAAKKSQSAEP